MKVVGIYPQLSIDSSLSVRSCLVEPLGLGRLLAIAAQDGCDVMYAVPIGESLESMIAKIDQFDPDIVGLSLMTCQMPAGLYVASHLKEKRRDRIILAGGYHPSAMHAVEAPFDAFVYGEGEVPFGEIIGSVKEGRDWTQGPGLVLAQGRTPAPERIRCLSDYPWALRDDRMLREAFWGLIYPAVTEQTGFAFVEYGRGCSWDCTYCCKNVIWGSTLTYREPADVVKEMLFLQGRKNVNLFFFADLNFTSSADHVLGLCQEMRRQEFHGSWFCMSNIATATDTVLEAMAEAGCVKVMFGIESVDGATLRRIHKGGSYAKEKRVVQTALDLGMMPHLFYMIGFPWDTPDTVRAATLLLEDVPGLQLRIGIATPLPGSAWFDEVQGSLTTRDWSLYDCEHLVYSHPHFDDKSTAEAVRSVYNSFYRADAYRRRVESFLGKFPRYLRSFREFFALLSESGYDTPAKDLQLEGSE